VTCAACICLSLIRTILFVEGVDKEINGVLELPDWYAVEYNETVLMYGTIYNSKPIRVFVGMYKSYVPTGGLIIYQFSTLFIPLLFPACVKDTPFKVGAPVVLTDNSAP
jgi:hypothetical protein